MRKIVAELFTSLDGVVGSPDQWHGAYHGEEMEHDIQAGLAAAGTMLLGRRTYQEHAGRRLFEGEGERLSCALVGSRTYTSGTISATYAINH